MCSRRLHSLRPAVVSVRGGFINALSREQKVGTGRKERYKYHSPPNASEYFKKIRSSDKKTCQLQFGRLMLKGMPKELARNKRSTKVCLSFPRARITRYSCSLHGETSCA